MANTINITGRNIDISAMDEDYESPMSYPIQSVQFVPGAAADELFIREGAVDGPIVFHVLTPATLTGDMYIKYFHGENHIFYIDESECNLSVGHHVLIEKR